MAVKKKKKSYSPRKPYLQRDLSYMKPKKFRNHYTLSELSAFVGKDPRWLRRLEDAGRIPKPVRVDMGELRIRLWSPAQAEEVLRIIKTHRVGRPSSDGR